jgi:RimJ/RimL family protein N-acetyltransferase
MAELTVSLQRWTQADLPLLVRLNAPEVMTHLGGPETAEQLATRQRRYVDAANSDTTYVFSIVIDPGHLSVGQVAFWERSWHKEAVFEMGWSVVPEFQGQGIGSRGAALALALAGETGKHRFVHAFPSVDNEASNAICRKLGFVVLEECDLEYPPGHTMRCNSWRFDLAGQSAGGAHHSGARHSVIEGSVLGTHKKADEVGEQE